MHQQPPAPATTSTTYQAGATDMLNSILGQLTADDHAGVPLDRPRILAALTHARTTILGADRRAPI